MASFAPYQLAQTDIAIEVDRAFLSAQLKQFNNHISTYHLHIRANPRRPLDLFLRTDTGIIVGGLVACTYWSWLDIEDLWLHADLRHQGYGRQLLALAEVEAQARGCRYAHLTTFSFQAQGFYEKAGYQTVGALENFPPGATYFWLRKDFAPA